MTPFYVVNTVYEHTETDYRSYQGIAIDDRECRAHLRGGIKDRLLDREPRQTLLDQLVALRQETGFNSSELIADIQAIENGSVTSPPFRVGEAYAEFILEEGFGCRFHWNEERDARNPRGNKTGADLVGFIEVAGQVMFLFGEVKTSSETRHIPPQVMTGSGGIESQLKDLYSDKIKRQRLILYLQSKAMLYSDNHPFKTDFEASLRAYYKNECKFQLMGVLVRDVDHDERDLSISYTRLSEQIAHPDGIKLVALYVPISCFEWQSIINAPVE